MERGRPTKYKDVYETQVEKLCKLGATDKEISDFFDINEDTLNSWKKKYPAFSDAIKKGKIIADAEVVERLYKRAIGYEHEEDKIFQYEGEPVIVPTIKRYPPDTTAIMFWLKNRQKDRFREKSEVDLNKNIESLSDEDLIKLGQVIIRESRKSKGNEGE